MRHHISRDETTGRTILATFEGTDCTVRPFPTLGKALARIRTERKKVARTNRAPAKRRAKRPAVSAARVETSAPAIADSAAPRRFKIRGTVHGPTRTKPATVEATLLARSPGAAREMMRARYADRGEIFSPIACRMLPQSRAERAANVRPARGGKRRGRGKTSRQESAAVRKLYVKRGQETDAEKAERIARAKVADADATARASVSTPATVDGRA